MKRKNQAILEGPTIHHYKHRRKPNRSVGGDIGIYIFLGIWSVIMVFPLVFSISSALKPLDELLKFPPDIYKIHFQYCIRNCSWYFWSRNNCFNGCLCFGKV